MSAERCTCERPTWDQPYVGACEFCEEQAWRTEHGQHDEDFEAMLDGAAELTAAERFAALAAMGEPDDSLMLGGSGGGERDPDLEWY